MRRRTFLGLLASVPAAGFALPSEKRSFLFKLRGAAGFLGAGDRLGFMNTDGTGFRVFDFNRPTEIGFGVCDFFQDGRRALLMSIETDEDWKTKPFEVYYPKSRTHIWICEIETGKLAEIGTRDRISPFYSPCLLVPGEQRMLVTVNTPGHSVLTSMNLDGSDPIPITAPNEFVYGVSLSPDGKRVAFHANYRICVLDINGSNRKEIAGSEGSLHFGTSWSPDGEWVLYQVCNPSADPGHDGSDIWIGRPDGSENVRLTEGNAAWFASSYGRKDNPGGGSIMPRWAPDGAGILYSRRLPDSRVPWEFQSERPDTTHFNRDFKPELARGGAEICFLDPKTKTSTPLTHNRPALWEFRADWSPDSRQILFCRAGVGENPAIWVMDRDGQNERRLTDGLNGNGVEFPRWMPPRK